MATGGKCKGVPIKGCCARLPTYLGDDLYEKCGALFAEVKRIIKDEAEGAPVNVQITKSGRLFKSQ
eukprot:scaffold109790_cov21-Tisochrysis_lutea.AAC.1